MAADGFRHNPPPNDSYHIQPKSSEWGRRPDKDFTPKKEVGIETLIDNSKRWRMVEQVWEDFKGQDYDEICDALYSIMEELIPHITTEPE